MEAYYLCDKDYVLFDVNLTEPQAVLLLAWLQLIALSEGKELNIWYRYAILSLLQRK